MMTRVTTTLAMRPVLPLMLALALLATLAVPGDAKKGKKKEKSGPPAPLAASKLARSLLLLYSRYRSQKVLEPYAE